MTQLGGLKTREVWYQEPRLTYDPELKALSILYGLIVTIAYRTTTAKPRFRQLSPRVAHPRTPKRSFGLLAFRTPRLPRFTFCATAEIET